MSDKNIDKDIYSVIKRLKEDVEFVKNRTMALCFRENVEIILSEVEKKDKELETYKKIAEKLANSIVSDEKILALTCKHIINKTEDECMKQNCLCDECIINWARKEVKENV